MIETPFNYTGSKYKLLTDILPFFDYTKPYFIDVFAGGGSVYTNVADKYKSIIVNDVITDLIDIHQRLVIDDTIINETKILCPKKEDKKAFLELRESYNRKPTPAKLWALLLSSTNGIMRFNTKFKYNQSFGERSWNPNTDKKVKNFIHHIRQYKDKVSFMSKEFDQIRIFSDDFMFYFDPPYGRIKNDDGSMGKTQINEAGYNVFWKQDDDKKLYDFLHKVNENGSSFMISGVITHENKTCWLMDKLLSEGFYSKQLESNKMTRKGDRETIELIITNYSMSDPDF